MMVHFWTYAHPSYCLFDLQARNFTAARWAPGHSAAALGPLAVLDEVLGPEIVLT